MLSHATYKLIHLAGIFLLFSGLGGLWALAALGSVSGGRGVRRLLMVGHGMAVVVILVAGFGMMARLGIMGAWPPWIWIKLAIWILMAIAPVLLSRAHKARTVVLYLVPLLGAIAAYAALFHPGAP